MLIAYVLPVIYVSLFPFSGWTPVGSDRLISLFTTWPRHITTFDLILNFLAYIPLGFLAGLCVERRYRHFEKMAIATGFIFALSVLMEIMQIYLPSRTSSATDILSNSVGGVIGVSIAAMIGAEKLTQMSFDRDRWFVGGACGNFGLALVAIWFLTQLNPSFPLFSSVLPLVDGSYGETGLFPSRFDFIEFLWAILSLGALGALITALALNRKTVYIALALILIGVLSIKLISASVLLRPQVHLVWLRMESVLGGLCAIALLNILRQPRQAVILAITLLILLIALTRIYIAASDPSITLTLFRRHYSQFLNYVGLAELASQYWPMLSLIFLASYWRQLITERRWSF